MNLVCHVDCVILPEPAHGCCLDPSRRFGLHFLGCLQLHPCEAIEALKATNALEGLVSGDNKDARVLVDVHQRLDPGAIKQPSVHHRCLLKLVLSIDLIDDLEDNLLHHEC